MMRGLEKEWRKIQGKGKTSKGILYIRCAGISSLAVHRIFLFTHTRTHTHIYIYILPRQYFLFVYILYSRLEASISIPQVPNIGAYNTLGIHSYRNTVSSTCTYIIYVYLRGRHNKRHYNTPNKMITDIASRCSAVRCSAARQGIKQSISQCMHSAAQHSPISRPSYNYTSTSRGQKAYLSKAGKAKQAE